MKSEKMTWRDEEARRSRRAMRKRIERRQEREDEMLIKDAIAMFNDYNGEFQFAGANNAW